MKLSNLSFYFGIISIPLSIAAWLTAPDLSGAVFVGITDPALRGAFAQAHAERWGIFVGLWAPTLLVLSVCLQSRNK